MSKNNKKAQALFKKAAKGKRKLIQAMLEDIDQTTLLADGFDAAILGFTESFPVQVIYDHDTCLHILQADGMKEEEAFEYFHFNVLGAHVGEQTPIFMHSLR
jgi:hypothetical protein